MDSRYIKSLELDLKENVIYSVSIFDVENSSGIYALMKGDGNNITSDVKNFSEEESFICYNVSIEGAENSGILYLKEKQKELINNHLSKIQSILNIEIETKYTI